MTTVFPTNNLPSAAQPWAREVQKQLSNVIASNSSERVNNTARDNQLNSSIIALSGVVGDVTSALTEIGLLEDTVLVDGEPNKINGANIKVGTLSASSITTGTLNASLVNVTNINAGNITAGSISGDRISGGTISGVTFNTTGGTARIVLSGTTMSFVDDIGSITGFIRTDGSYRGSFYLQGSGSSYLSLSSDGSSIGSNGKYVDCNSTGVILGGGPTYLTGNLFLNNVQRIGTAGRMFPRTDATTSSANLHIAGTNIDTSNNDILRSSSSIRYKLDPQDAEYGLRALELKPRTWVDKLEFEKNNNSAEGLARIPGFIAEEVYEAGLEEFVIFNENGQVESLHYDRMLGAVIPVLKHQQNVIQDLSARIETLEKGA
mgnify:CR=1 FL=1